MRPLTSVNPDRLDEAGWGVIFKAEADPAIREALEPLLTLRSEQAGELFRVFAGSDGYRPDDSKSRFLARYGEGPGPANPYKVPYYLLIVGDLLDIPCRFQAQLAVQRAVGRLWFDNSEDFHHYAESVVETEMNPPRRQAEAVIFAPDNEDDLHTAIIVNKLLPALIEGLDADLNEQAWQMKLVSGPEASRERLIDLLQQSPPRLLVTAGHGLAYPTHHPLQRANQGGIVCQNWPGPKQWTKAIPVDYCVLGSDLPVNSDFSGMISLHYSSYSLGTPGLDEDGTSRPNLVPEARAHKPFIARLPQRLLGAPAKQGALAVIGFTDRVWTFGSGGEYITESMVLSGLLSRLIKGHPIGEAFRFVSERYAELANEVAAEIEEIKFGKTLDAAALVRLWTASNDVHNLAILGDPAVRVQVGKTERAIAENELIAVDEGDEAVDPKTGKALRFAFRIVRAGSDTYSLELFAVLSRSRGKESTQSISLKIQFDMNRLRELELDADPLAYGQALMDAIFPSRRFMPFAKTWYHLVKSFPRVGYHFQLEIDWGARELQALRWETMFGSGAGNFLALSENTYFTRLLTRPEWARIELRKRGELRALLVDANPPDQDESSGKTEDMDSAYWQIWSSIAGIIPTMTLSKQKNDESASLDRMIGILATGPVDILYLHCYSALVQDEPHLWLEDDDGHSDVVPGHIFVEQFSQLRQPPLLAILDGGQYEALAILGPRLAEAGVAAVLTLQGQISEETASLFLAVFFKELLEGNQVDEAASAARKAVGDRPDWWMPVLFQRVRDGRLW